MPENTANSSSTSNSRNLLHSLLDYIHEQAKTVDPRGFRLSAAKGFLRRRPSIAGLPGIEFDLKEEGDHTWLRVQRLDTTLPPALPADVRDLFTVNTDPAGFPPSINELALKARVTDSTAELSPEEEVEQLDRLRLTAEADLTAYLARWQLWAEGETPRRATIKLYGELFALKHQLEAEEAARPQELVWGVGLASWNIPYEEDVVAVEYPLLTQALEISIDERTMDLELRPRTIDTRLEMNVFNACGVKGSAELEVALREQLKRIGASVTPFDATSYGDILRSAAGNLDSNGQYRELQASNGSLPTPGANLVVSDEWALFSRPRSNNFLLEDLARLQQQVDKCDVIPEGPLSLVTPPGEIPVAHTEILFRGLSSRNSGVGGQTPKELYFPLPYNDEQVTVIQRLEQSPGVTVQGPPGTGKTHTIANIICHYLANGKRVLVTSRGEQALEVLQSKIPKDVRRLTVSLLSSDREGVRQLQASTEAIQREISQLNPDQTKREIKDRQSAIDRAHVELAQIDRRVDEIAATQLDDIEVDGAKMRAIKIAELVVSGHAAYGWFDDIIDLRPAHAPPLSHDEAATLREARRVLQQDLLYVGAKLPHPDDLPPTDEIVRLHETAARMRRIDARVSRGEVLDLKSHTPELLERAQWLLRRIRDVIPIVAELETLEGGWAMTLREKCRQARFKSEREALESLFDDIDALVAARAAFLKQPVEFPDAGLACPKTREAVKRAASSGKPFGLMAFGVAEARQHLANVKVSGLAPQSKESWQHIDIYVELHQKVLSFLVRWNTFADELSLPQLTGGVSRLRAIEQVATAAKTAHTLATNHDPELAKLATQVFEHPPHEALAGASAALSTVQEHLDNHITKASLSQATVRLTALQDQLGDKSGQVVDALRGFLQGDLGNTERTPEEIAARYSELVAELRRLSALGSHLARVQDYCRRIEHVAPGFAHRLRARPVAAAGDDPVLPTNWREAWTWARLKAHLESIESRNELTRIFGRRLDLENGLAKLYQEMVAKSAWLSTKQNATPKVLQALAAYASAIRRIGQGTGPNATRYRRDARDAMSDAAEAVPCWIMSHARVSEAMPASIGAFDLVIVDEASQSNLWALPAILRGKKILVVGDDKQVSPDGGFIASARIDELRKRFLTDQPYGSDMTPEKSLYDLASRIFATHQVMLREHFRCVPAIIEYSNRTFYKDNIQPLRIPSANERIDPPLVDIYVPHGVRNQRSCNEAEAHAIAEEIAAIMDDPKMANRSIGVVSLLGLEQAKLIDSVVRERCDAAELLRRRFDCGDARTFQGSERDIMFLSMVVDRKSSRALSGNMYDQRFNVAASRARDRMYLIRSVQAADLSDKDLRLTLLKHFDQPIVKDETTVESLSALCESGFEKDVFERLTDRGFRVTPQVHAGAYRIDLVVEGASNARLAIELDGDDYHGPDRWPQDMARQRVLERAGWVFWRCFASTWTMHKEDVFSELVAKLQAMNIEPIGAMDRIPALVEKRVWQGRPEDSEAEAVVEAVLEKAVEAARTDSIESPSASTVQPDAPSSPIPAQPNIPPVVQPENLGLVLSVQQYEGGPWWSRVFPANEVAATLAKTGALQSMATVTGQSLITLAQRNLGGLLDDLVDTGATVVAEAVHELSHEAERTALKLATAQSWEILGAAHE